MLTLLAAAHQSIKTKKCHTSKKPNRKTVCLRNSLIEIGAISDEKREKKPPQVIGFFLYDLFSNCAIEVCKDA